MSMERLPYEMIDSKPLYFFKGMEGKNKIMDFTLPYFRGIIKSMKIPTEEEKEQTQRKKDNANYWKKNGKKINNNRQKKYNIARKNGFSSKDSNKLSKKNWKEFYNIINRGYIEK